MTISRYEARPLKIYSWANLTGSWLLIGCHGPLITTVMIRRHLSSPLGGCISQNVWSCNFFFCVYRDIIPVWCFTWIFYSYYIDFWFNNPDLECLNNIKCVPLLKSQIFIRQFEAWFVTSWTVLSLILINFTLSLKKIINTLILINLCVFCNQTLN